MSQTARVILKLGNVPPSDILKGKYLLCTLERESVARAPARPEWGLQLGEVTWGEKVGKGWKTSEGGIRKSPFAMLFSLTTFLHLFPPPPPPPPPPNLP